MQLPPLFLNFEAKERKYFIFLAREHERELSLHKILGGLYEKDESGKNWGNVIEHCLMEAARVRVFSRKLHLSPDCEELLIQAAILHDFYKRMEIEAIKKDKQGGGTGWAGLIRAQAEANVYLARAGFTKSVIDLVNSVGGDPKQLSRIKEILDQEKSSDLEMAFIIMHYVDGYTKDAEWARPAEKTKKNFINDVDRRMQKNIARYGDMERKEVIKYQNNPMFQGKIFLEVDAELNHLIENKIVSIIRERAGTKTDPIHLPEIIDAEIKNEIQKLS